jgi:hypothetical protein
MVELLLSRATLAGTLRRCTVHQVGRNPRNPIKSLGHDSRSFNVM